MTSPSSRHPRGQAQGQGEEAQAKRSVPRPGPKTHLRADLEEQDKEKVSGSGRALGRIVALKNCKAVTRGRQWDLENDRKLTQIGRNHASHVQFLDLTISGLHLELHPQVGSDGVLKKVEMIDKSSNGTWHNGKRMTKHKRTLLRSGDVFSLVQNYRTGGENVAAFRLLRHPKQQRRVSALLPKVQARARTWAWTYATVRHCSVRGTGKVFAVKIIDLNAGRAQGWEIKELIKNAKNEAAMQQELAHPNVIDLEEMFVDEDAGTVYMVMEYMEGRAIQPTAQAWALY